MANPDAIVLASNFWDISRLWQLDPAWMRDTPVFPQDLMASWRANFTTIAQKFKVGCRASPAEAPTQRCHPTCDAGTGKDGCLRLSVANCQTNTSMCSISAQRHNVDASV